MNKTCRINMPEQVRQIIARLEEAGYEAYAVGGCVRDVCLGRTPNDWDITTSASPMQVKALFARTVDTGIEHGTVTVMLGKEGYEVTTFRIDGAYEDARHPKEVIFTPELSEDLRRRDFTINAMAYNDRVGLVDIFGGQEDLVSGMIRCVGNAMERFSEDALRILRAVRFSAQLGFTIEEETAEATKRLAPNLEKISAERIHTELSKTLVSEHPDWLESAYQLGITRVVLPEYDALMERDRVLGEHILQALRLVEPKLHLRLALLMAYMGDGEKPSPTESADTADRMLRRLKSDRETMRRVHGLILLRDTEPPAQPAQIRQLAAVCGRDTFSDYLRLRKAGNQAAQESEEKRAALEQTEALWEKILADKDPLSVKELCVTGRDLMALGMKPGKALGEVLSALLEKVLEDPQKNEKEYLLEAAKTLAPIE